MAKFIEMTFDEWLETYKPITNHIDSNASFQDESGNGIMFETYGDEVEFVKSQSPDKIWMYGQGDGSGTYIWNGWGFVNRLGYFITEVPCPADTDIQVAMGDEDVECTRCEESVGEEWICESYDTVCRDCCNCGCNA